MHRQCSGICFIAAARIAALAAVKTAAPVVALVAVLDAARIAAATAVRIATGLMVPVTSRAWLEQRVTESE